MKAFLVDDEELALKRLARLLVETGRVEVAGSSTDPVNAVSEIEALRPEVLFLDIQMPGLNGFEMLRRLDPQPLVVFTTAYDSYALRAFGVNSIDYLLKPVEAEHLERALNKIERIRGGVEVRPEIRLWLEQLTAAARQEQPPRYPDRVSSKTGDKLELIPLASVSHFFANEKLTFAATPAKQYSVDYTIQELEQKLDPGAFVRIHRSTLLNLQWVHELHVWFAGRMLVRLKDEKHTELIVSRDRVKVLKEKLGI